MAQIHKRSKSTWQRAWSVLLLLGLPPLAAASCGAPVAPGTGPVVALELPRDAGPLPAAPDAGDAAASNDAQPPTARGSEMRYLPRSAKLHAYWLDRRLTTVADYEQCVAAGACSDAPLAVLRGSAPSGPDAPMCFATPDEAAAYCQWAGKRLPTFDEWREGKARATVIGLEAMKSGATTPEEWTATLFCSPLIGGCGHAHRTTDKSFGSDELRSPPTTRSSGLSFRCARSQDALPPEPTVPPLDPRTEPTPGRVGCLTTSCDLKTEQCCASSVDLVGHCIPKGAQCGGGDQAPQPAYGGLSSRSLGTWQCDESADCKPGQVCCDDIAGWYDWETTTYTCERFPCGWGAETCRGEGGCTKGFACVKGTCLYQHGPLGCGAATCSGPTPVCCWNPVTSTGSCVADRCQDELQERRFACAAPQDCGGIPCQTYGAPGNGYHCRPQVWTGEGSFLCRTVKDCPNQLTGAVSIPPTPPKACRPDPELPPGMKSCEY